MKKIFVICLIAFLLSGCTKSPSNIDETRATHSYDVGYDEGYEAGVNYVLNSLRENANDFDAYVSVDNIEQGIREYYKNDDSVDVDDMRDMIIFSGENELRTLREILEELIDYSIDE